MALAGLSGHGHDRVVIGRTEVVMAFGRRRSARLAAELVIPCGTGGRYVTAGRTA
jgi:hypothetical protein